MTKLTKELKEAMYDPKTVQQIKEQYIDYHIEILKNKIKSTKRKDLKVKYENEIDRITLIRNDPGQKIRTYDPAPKASASRKPTIKLVSGIPKTWFAAMVTGIKRSSDVRNPYQIVMNIWKRLPVHTQADTRRRAAKGEVFKYDLPLPKDLATRGTGTLRIVKPFKLAEAQVNLTAKDMAVVKASGIFRPMKRADGSTCQVARCKGIHPVNIFVDQV